MLEKESLISEGSRILFKGSKWGSMYLVSPEILINVSLKTQGSTKKLSDFLTGERYLNTGGADGFFVIKNAVKNPEGYFSVQNSAEEGTSFSGLIEEKYLVPLIKDYTKNNPKPILDGYDAFCLVANNISENDKVTEYIKWGEVSGFNSKSVTRTQRPWYKPTIQMQSPAEILLPRSFNNRFVCYLNKGNNLSLRFYRFHLLDKDDSFKMAAYMNSTLFWLYFESFGNRNQGQGVLDFYMDDLLNMKLPIVMDSLAADAFKVLGRRAVQPIYLECGIDPNSDVSIEEQEPQPLADRAQLDKVIFDVLGLSEDERKDVYRALCLLVHNRLNRANTV